jgi:toluene monooxygenase system protein E
VPTSYEIASSKLHYYPEKGFAVRVPAGEWHARQRATVRLKVKDLDRFSDPRAMTYADYVKRRSAQEQHLDSVHRFHAAKEFDATLSDAWITRLERVWPVLRYPVHGLQMLAAQCGHLTPSGGLTIALAFQAGDELRRINRIAYRMAEIRQHHPEFGDGALRRWEAASEWQPLREVIERLLVTFAWDETLLALNLVLKPALHAFCTGPLRVAAEAAGDTLLPGILFSLGEDEAWHTEWCEALVRLARDDDAANVDTLALFRERWQPLAEAAVAALQPLLA